MRPEGLPPVEQFEPVPVAPGQLVPEEPEQVAPEQFARM